MRLGRAALTIGLVSSLWPAAAQAFLPEGHEIIEATAYRRLLTMERVPLTEVSGRALLVALMRSGVLRLPTCLERRPLAMGCGEPEQNDLPLGHWPQLRAGGADLILDRQLSARGQAQHFMAETADALSPLDESLGVPGDLARAAYRRCITVMTAVLDGILRDPALAFRRVVGMYPLIHGIEDSFSAAHVDRDEQLRIVHLLSWALIDWPRYFLHGRWSFPSATHHAIHEKRDEDYLLPAEERPDCHELHQPWAIPEDCLTPRARAAADAVFDLLVLTYRLQARAAAESRRASLAAPEDAALWREYVEKHLPSAVVETVDLSVPAWTAPRRPDVLLGALGGWKSGGWALGIWSSRLLYGPAIPFLLSLEGAVAIGHAPDEGDTLAARAGVGFLLPLVRRFAIGVSPLYFELPCDTHFDHCHPGWGATLGHLLIPIGGFGWVALQGPAWSWNQGAFRGSRVSLAFGWAHERSPRFVPPAPEVLEAWRPPPRQGVTSFRRNRISRLIFITGTAGTTDANGFVGAGLAARLDRDRWNRRAGVAPGLSLELDNGRTDGTMGAVGTLSPELCTYILPSRLSVSVEPARLRVGALAGHTVGVDLGARLSVGVSIGVVEVSVASPFASYLAPSRWRLLPFSLRIGLFFD
jgi:hypothetical protein